MDWIITDRWETPPELEHFYSERLLRMPDGYVCYSPPPYAPDVAPLPALANGHITFGCFNNLAKITPRVIATWCGILHRVPDARLVLKMPSARRSSRRATDRAGFAAHGVGAARLELRGPSRPSRASCAQYNDIDIVLDPFPYSGGLTTCEALWMGVPTVAVPGETFASRHSMSHLSNAGLADWVAPDIAAYMELAVSEASDIAALAELRARLRAQVKASPLCDAPRFGRNLGAALRHAWRDWCARQWGKTDVRASDRRRQHDGLQRRRYDRRGDRERPGADLARRDADADRQWLDRRRRLDIARTTPRDTAGSGSSATTATRGRSPTASAPSGSAMRIMSCRRPADDLIAPDFVEQLMGVLLERPDCVMCHAGGLVFTGAGQVRRVYPPEHRLTRSGPTRWSGRGT